MSRTVVSKIWDYTTLLTPLWLSATTTYVEFAITSFIFSSMIFFIIPKTTGFGLSKRRVSFHKTTRIFFEGFSHPFFLFRALSRLRVLSSLWFVLRRRFVRSESVLLFRALSRRFCSFRFCFSLALAAFSLVFPLFCDWTLLFSWFCLVILILCVLLRCDRWVNLKRPAFAPVRLFAWLFLFVLFLHLGYIIPKTTGGGFSKRWVSFHETTRILFEGFSSPLCLFWVLSRLRVLSWRFCSFWVGAFVCFASVFRSFL